MFTMMCRAIFFRIKVILDGKWGIGIEKERKKWISNDGKFKIHTDSNL